MFLCTFYTLNLWSRIPGSAQPQQIVDNDNMEGNLIMQRQRGAGNSGLECSSVALRPSTHLFYPELLPIRVSLMVSFLLSIDPSNHGLNLGDRLLGSLPFALRVHCNREQDR